MRGFWHRLSQPIKVLAPMENVTDTVFRSVVVACGRPDVLFTEFTNVDLLFGCQRDKLMTRLQFTEQERPIVAQIWGSEPDNYYRAAQLLREIGVDGIDINMGCAASKIRRKNTCAGLINYPSLAAELIQATREGAKGLPLSVKTRLGFDRIQTEEWLPFLLQQQLDALIIHARIAMEMTRMPADWNQLHTAVSLRDAAGVPTLIIGNGDVNSLDDLYEKHRHYNVNGVMIGRAILRDPFLFHPHTRLSQLSPTQKITLLLQHTRLFVDTWGERKRFDIMKKFFKLYISGFEGDIQLRTTLMQQDNCEGTIKILERHLGSYGFEA